MTIESNNGSSFTTVVQSVVKRHGTSKDGLIPILSDVNHEIGYLPSKAIEEVARLLHLPKSQVFSVSTFYQMLSTKEMGRHVILFCESAPCHVVGGREVWQKLQTELNLNPGETSPDQRWTLITVSCLGVCGVGPVMVVDEDMFGNVTPDMVPDILARYS